MYRFKSTSSPVQSLLLVILLISTALSTALTLPRHYNVTEYDKKTFTRSLPFRPFESRHDLTSPQYQSLFDTLAPKGYRLLQVTGYVSASEDRFAALFEQSPGPPQLCYHGLTSDGYQKKFDAATDKGYRPVLVNGYTSASGSDKYVAIFEKPETSPSWVARHGMTSATYQQEFDTWVARGYRLTHVSGYGVGSEALYAAIFEKPTTSPAWVARHGLTSSQYQAEFDAQIKAGFTLTLVSGYTVNNVDYYAAIFERLSGVKPWIARHGLTSRGYQGESTNLYYQGYRLKCLSGYTISNTARFAAIWENLYFSPSDLNKIDTALESYVSKRAIVGLSVAITRDDNLVFAKGLGVSNKDTGEAVNPDHLFRIASISKTMTAITIMKLIEQRKLKLRSRVFGPGAILGEKFGTKPYNQETLDIRVQHLLEHTSGIPNVGAEWKGLLPEDAITWVLDNDQPTIPPGTKSEYSNFGYTILGRVIEATIKPRETYENYLRGHILNSSPQSPNRMLIGDPELKPNEVTYYPGDGANRRLFDSFGGWIARPIDLVGVLSRVDGLSKSDIISSATRKKMWTPSKQNSTYAKGWRLGDGWRGHDGFFPQGTISWLVRRDDGFGFAVIVNSMPTGDGSSWELKSLIDGIIATVGAWPAYDLF